MLEIKKATVADIPTIRDIAGEAFPATYRDILTPEQLAYMMEWMYSAGSLRSQMEDEGHTFFLAIADGEPVGYVSMEQQGPDLFHLQKIYVLPSRQTGGIGRRLFEHVIETIRTLHPTPCRMELNVNRYNRALGFYEHMGMRRDRQGDFDIGHGYFMNDYIMALDLA